MVILNVTLSLEEDQEHFDSFQIYKAMIVWLSQVSVSLAFFNVQLI